ncbi:MAG: hypothetical protein AAF682_20800 [Planctomycetota bacterium]
MRRLSLAALALLGGLAGSGCSKTVDAAEPGRLELFGEFDLGVVRTPTAREVRLRNASGAAWTEIELKTSCGCLGFHTEQSTVAPGEELIATASVDPRREKRGAFHQKAYVRTQPEGATYYAEFHGLLLPPAQAEPSTLVVTLDPGQESAEAALRVVVPAEASEPPPRIARVEGTGARVVELAFDDPERIDDAWSVPLRATLAADPERRDYADALELDVSTEAATVRTRVALRAEHRTVYSALPQSLVLRRDADGRVAGRLSVQVGAGAPPYPAVEDWSTEPPLVGAFEPDAGGLVRFSFDVPAGVTLVKLRVRNEHGELEVPMVISGGGAPR